MFEPSEAWPLSATKSRSKRLKVTVAKAIYELLVEEGVLRK